MRSILHFNKLYFVLTLVLLGIEILIAKFAHDKFIRPYGGDLLVVILIYCFIKTFLNTPVVITAIAVLLFSYTIETLQYFQIVNKLGLGHSTMARVVIGTSFEWADMVAYTVGIALVIFLEGVRVKRSINAVIKTL